VKKEEEAVIKHANPMFVFLDVIIIIMALFSRPQGNKKIFIVSVLEYKKRDKQNI
jgi:hypothetical protein